MWIWKTTSGFNDRVDVIGFNKLIKAIGIEYYSKREEKVLKP